MDIKISRIEEATSEQWDTVVNQCDYATFFHSRGWAEIWEEYRNGKVRSVAKYITFNDGVEVLCPIMVQKISRGLLKQYMSGPEWQYGGWLSLHTLNEKHHNALLAYSYKLSLIFRQNPFDKSFPTDKVPWNDIDYTQVLDLRQGFDSIRNNWLTEHRSAVRNAERAVKAGVTLEEGITEADWQAYYRIYELAVVRWGDNLKGEKFDWRLYDLILKRRTKNVKLWIVKLDNKIIGGAIRFYQNKHVMSWNKAILRDYAKSYASNLLDYELIKHSCESGYWWYDLDTSAGLEGVIAYKTSLGTTQLSANVLVNESAMKRLSNPFRTALLSMSQKLSKPFHKSEDLTRDLDAGYSGKIEEQNRLEVPR